MNKSEQAVDYFSQGYNCAQATAAVFAEGAGLQCQMVLNMMAGFGGGLGGSREICGAVSGMVSALGFFNGSYDPHDLKAKTAFYKLVRDAIEEFRGKFGSTSCRELLLKAGSVPKPDPCVRNAEYYAKRPCAHFVREAAEIATRRISPKAVTDPAFKRSEPG